MSLSDSAALLDTTMNLCAIPSVTGSETALCKHVEALLKDRVGQQPEWGQVVRHDDSVVLRPERRGNRPLVVLAGHLDTVPPRQDRADHVRNGWLEACGASDMKAALAVMIHLVADTNPANLSVDLGLAFYAREEGPYLENDLRNLLQKESFLGDSDLVICMEPTNNKVQVGCVGGIHATLTFHGKRAHSARPWHGINAIHSAAPFLTRLNQLQPKDVAFGPLIFREVASITMVEGYGTRNVVPDQFSVNLNYRFAPGKSLDTAKQDILDLVAGDADVEFTDLAPAGHTCLDNPLLAPLLERTGPPEPKQAWTDVAQFSAIGVDAVNCGPGDTAQAHQRNEGIRVEAIAESYRLVREWLEE